MRTDRTGCLGSAPGRIAEVQLLPGDKVLLHTDGITDARRGDSERFGAERFTTLVSSLLVSGEPPEELLRRVVSEILGFQDYHAGDDATLLLIGWRLPHGRLE